MGADSIIRCREVTKYYPSPASLRSFFRRSSGKTGTCVLDRVSFDVGAGEIFGIAGPNGAGKTTIMKIISHLTPPSSGGISVCGYDTERQWRQAVRCIGYCISEERSFFWRLTGRQNLLFFADLFEVPVGTARTRIGELFELLDLAAVADERFMNYSSGMKQKMAIARSLLASPRVLLMDEPTRALDPRAAARLRSFIETYISGGDRAAIVTSNQIADIEGLCRNMAILDHGVFIALGTVAEIQASARELAGAEAPVSFERAFEIIVGRHEERLARSRKG